ncbi:MAG: hypothetical protein MSC30_08995 [Gaiellaceae bacterium MAG52_C11]|nr:hypothetical protein [Candidatus Gaiellasilicea maunaloa]
MSEISLEGRAVLETGAGRGSGAAYAPSFAARGSDVVVHDAGVALDGSGGAVAGLAAYNVGKMAGFALMLVTAAEGTELASDRCTVSGVVLRAHAGRFGIARWHAADEVDLGRSPASPEAGAERWYEIEEVHRTG